MSNSEETSFSNDGRSYAITKDSLLSSLIEHGSKVAAGLKALERKTVDFARGEQWEYGEKKKNKAMGRETSIQGNEIIPILKGLTNVYLDKMGEPVLSLTKPSFEMLMNSNPSEEDDPNQMAVDQLNFVLHDFFSNKGGHDVFAMAFERSFFSGMSLVALERDFSFDRSEGDLKATLLETKNYIVDPDTTRRDLSDCEYVITERVIGRSVADSFYNYEKDSSSGQGQDLSRTVNSKDRLPDYWKTRVKETTLYRRVIESVPHAFNEETDVYTPLMSDREVDLAKELEMPIVHKGMEVIEKSIFINRKLATPKKGKGSWQRFHMYYPFVIVAPIWIESGASLLERAVSIVCLLSGPQRAKNLLQVQINAARETPLNNGFIVSGNAVSKDAIQQGSSFITKGTANILYIDGAGPEDVRRIDPPSIPAGYFEEMAASSENILKAIGATRAYLDAQSGNESAIHLFLKREASHSASYGYVRQVYKSIEAFTRSFLFQLRFWSPYKWNRSLGGEEPSTSLVSMNDEFVYGSFYTGALPKISVEEMPYSPSQRQIFAKQYDEINQILASIPPNSPVQRELFDLMAANLPLVGRGMLMKMFKRIGAERAEQDQKKKDAEDEILAEERQRKNDESNQLMMKRAYEIELIKHEIKIAEEKAFKIHVESKEISAKSMKMMAEAEAKIVELIKKNKSASDKVVKDEVAELTDTLEGVSDTQEPEASYEDEEPLLDDSEEEGVSDNQEPEFSFEEEEPLPDDSEEEDGLAEGDPSTEESKGGVIAKVFRKVKSVFK